jgi:lambda family phage portal protein
MFAWLRNIFGRKESPQSAAFRAALRNIQGRYDAAQNTDENARRWRQVDLLSARAANSFNVRRILRTRSRYVIANNSYAQGIVHNKVRDLIGTGPTPQVDAGPASGQLEREWAAWSEAVRWLEKLTTTSTARIGDGEGFLVLTNYDRIEHPVQLYPRDIEADQVTTPQPLNLDEFFTDGMTLDRMGNPVSYDLLKTHPGDFLFPNLNPLEMTTVDARYAIHWFRKDRPGQVRGIPELTPALELFEQMRTFRMATLSAAEAAALFTVLIKATGPAATVDDSLQAMTTTPVERGMITNLPYGFDAAQMKAEHPSTTYEVFIYCLLAEACRCLNVPLNIALGTSQHFNFSSARLDHINYRDALRIERRQCEQVVLTPLFYAWLEEAAMIPGYLPRSLDPRSVRVTWHWPGWSYLDPLKDAQADSERLKNKTLTYSQWYAEEGKDWEEEFEQLALEKKAMDRLGLSPADVDPAKRNPQGGKAGKAPVRKELAHAA